AVVFPEWAGEASRNFFGAELRATLLQETNTRQWNSTFYQEPGQWDDPLFATRLLSSGCTALLALNASHAAALALAKLRDAAVPVVTIGGNLPAVEMLQVPVVDGDAGEAIYRLVREFLARGLERFVIAGYAEPRLGARRVEGCRKALEQFRSTTTADAFIESFD